MPDDKKLSLDEDEAFRLGWKIKEWKKENLTFAVSYYGWIGDIRIIFSEKVSTYKFNEVKPRHRNIEPDRNYNIMVEYFKDHKDDNRVCIETFNIEDKYGDKESQRAECFYEYILANLKPDEENTTTLIENIEFAKRKLIEEGIKYARGLL